MKKIIFNSISPNYKRPLGANKTEEDIYFNIYITTEYHLYDLLLVIENDAKTNEIYMNMHKSEATYIIDGHKYNHYSISVVISNADHYWYYFSLRDVYGIHFIIPDKAYEGYLSDEVLSKWYLGIHDEFLYESSWPLGRLIYQIMPDRFASQKPVYKKDGIIFHEDWTSSPLGGKNIGRDFFGGNLRGLISKLDYLVSLGVGLIYLNPIFEAASNHKYDTGDYLKIDPMFGSEDDLSLLIKEADARNIKIILDGVFNHSGDDSIYFNKYNHYDSLGAYQSLDSPFYNWYKFTNYPKEYASWWGFKTLPSFNQNDESFLRFITGDKGVIDKWLNFGLAGFRLDVIDELNDNLIERIFAKTKEINHENFIIGEVWEDAATKTSYSERRNYFNGRQVDSVMNYPLKEAIIDFILTSNVEKLKNTQRMLISHYPKYILDRLMNILGTHDTKRIMTVFKKDEKNAFKYLQMASALQYTLPGLPSIYYGDEIGLEGERDPDCRKTFNWEALGNEVNKWYKLLGKIRKEKVFTDGIYSEEYIKDGVFAFSRTKDNEKVIVIINRSLSEFSYPLDQGINLLTNKIINTEAKVASLSLLIVKLLIVKPLMVKQ